MKKIIYLIIFLIIIPISFTRDISINSENLLLYLPLENDTSDLAYNITQAGNNTFLKSGNFNFNSYPLCVDKGIPNCMETNISKYLYYGNITSTEMIFFKNNENFTICGWVSLDSNSSSTGSSIFQYGRMTDRNAYLTYENYLAQEWKLYLFEGNLDVFETKVSSNATINNNVLDYLCVVYNNGISEELFRNGISVGYALTNEIFYQTTDYQIFYLFNCYAETVTTFDGYVSRFTYYNITLTQDEINLLYNNKGIPYEEIIIKKSSDDDLFIILIGTAITFFILVFAYFNKNNYR